MDRFSGSKHTGSRVRNDAGFTLVEIMVAVFVFAILVTTLFSSFNFLFKNVDSIRDAGKYHDMAARFQLRFIMDLESAVVTPRAFYIPPEIGEPPDPHRIAGGYEISGSDGEPAIRFSSLTHLPFYGDLESETAEIVYYFDPAEGEEGGVVRRSDRVVHDDDFQASEGDPVVCESVESVSFTFFDQDGDAHDQWDSDSDKFSRATPRAVELAFRLSGKSGAFDFGTRVVLPAFREKREE